MHESCVPLRNHRARLRFTGAHALYYEIRLQGLWLGIEAVSGMDECRIGYMIRAIYLSNANSGMFLQNV
jgi:hypothetical protein